MKTLSLAVLNILSRPLHALLCIVSSAASIALLCSLFLLSQGVSSGLSKNAKGVDIIVGAKGSPLQLVLSSVYHVDIPSGNIDIDEYEALKRNPHIRKAIPLVLGDSYKGYRMVGTTSEYLDLYGATFASGHVFEKPFDTVVGARTGLKIGDKFAVTHGFSADSDDVHDAYLYTVTGVLNPTGTVLDKLLTTQVKSVQKLHSGHKQHHDHDHEEAEEEHEYHHHHHDDHDDEEEADFDHQVTSVFLKVRSPIDMMNLPRQLNEDGDIIAAVPAYEITRLAKSIGVGRNLIVAIGLGVVAISMLMLFSSLASGLALRQYDLAVLRVLGARPFRLSLIVIFEAILVSCAGALIGVIAGHFIAYGAVLSFDGLKGIILPISMLRATYVDFIFIMCGALVGIFASFIPACNAARTDIALLLAKGRS